MTVKPGDLSGPPPTWERWSDTHIAREIAVEHHQRLRFCPSQGWLVFDGCRWQSDNLAPIGYAQATVRRLAHEIVDGTARKSELAAVAAFLNEPRLRAAIALARSHEKLAVTADQLDNDPWLLNCQNGLLDLKTGTLSHPDPASLCTKMAGAPYDPAATAPRFHRFLEEIFGSDRELIAWLQRFLGYSLTGDTREHTFAIWHGTGANGKSTLLNLIGAIMGDYHQDANWRSFAVHRDPATIRNDLAALRGARLVSANEGHSALRLDSPTVKACTGGDPITCRHLYRDPFTYTPAFKLVLVTNYLPVVDGNDPALWRRLRRVPFNQNFEGREDRELGRRLWDEAPGVLRWMVEGCLTWQLDGLGSNATVREATDDYRTQSDPIADFLACECVLESTATVDARSLRARYEVFCEQAGERPVHTRAWGEALRRHGCERTRSGRERGWRGIRLRETVTE